MSNKITCECGSSINKYNISVHKLSKVHSSFIKSNNYDNKCVNCSMEIDNNEYIYCISCYKSLADNNKLCNYSTCITQATYNIKGSKFGKFCVKHKEPDMVNIKSKVCSFEGCNTQPSYNIKGETTAKFCTIHKQEGMINVKDRSCEFENCLTIPIYNFKNESKAKFCSIHKQEGMVNVKDAKCKYPDCDKIPNYNFKGEKRGIYCFTHKEENMEDVVCIFCAFKDCNVRASFNYEKEKLGKFCIKHKLEGMINVKSKKCSFDGCLKQPTFNFKNEKEAIYCSTHKKPEMFDVLNKKCYEEGCDITPHFNFKNEKKGIYCCKHKQPDMIDITSKRCKSEFCNTIANKKYKGYCSYCFFHLFPDEKSSKNYKTKELTVLNYIKEEFPLIDIVSDKKIADGCSRRRPDIFIHLGYQIVIIEVDENQHNDYDTTCENKRIMELSKDVNHIPIVFIRFNPDDYIDSSDTKIKSCFAISRTELCSVNKKNEKEWNRRLSILKKTLEFHLKEENKSDKTITIISLFYDEI